MRLGVREGLLNSMDENPGIIQTLDQIVISTDMGYVLIIIH